MEDQAQQNNALAGGKNPKIGLTDDADATAPPAQEEEVVEESDKKENTKSNEAKNTDTFPQFLAHHDPFQLLVDAGISIAKDTCIGGAIHVGKPSKPNKDSTMAYLMEKIGPVVLDFRRDEAGAFNF